MLGNKPNKVYDTFLKAGLGYKNPERLKKAIAAQQKMYDGEMLHCAKLKIDSPDSEETLEDAEESRLKMRNKMVQINYGKLNALYETFVPQQEFSVEQTYFSIPFTSNNGSESKEVTLNLPIPKKPNEKSSNSVRRKKSKDTKSKDRVLKNKNDKRPSAHVRKMSSSVSKDSNKRETMHSNVIQLVLWIGCSKHMTNNLQLLINFIEKCIGTVHFGNDHFAAITGYGDYVQGNLTICHVYYVEGLGHNLFSVGQFCDGDLEVSFRSNTCYVRNLEGDDLLTGSRDSNLYTISISKMAASSLVCLMFRATSTKSWLWHRRLSHLNFGTINQLMLNDLVDGLPKFKYKKDHICSACKLGKSMKSSFLPKLVPSTESKLELLHMDLCGPMRVASINGFRIYNHRTKKIMERIHVKFDELTTMASECNNSGPRINCTNFQDSSEDSQSVPSKIDLHNLFGPLFEEYYATSSPEVSDNFAANTLDNDNTSSSLSIFIEEDEAPQIVSLSAKQVANEPNSAVLNENADEFVQEDIANLDGTFFTMHLQLLFSLVAKGYRQEDGIDFEGSFAPVARLESPDGFVDPDFPNHVYRLKKALYGLKQAPRAWYDKLSSFLIEHHFTKDLQGAPVVQTKYHSMIGGLMYLTAGRPNIAFVTFVCARYQDSGFELIAYKDADLAGCNDDCKSTSGGIQFLGDKLVSWSLKKKDCTTMLTAEAEYVSLSACCAQENVEKGTIELYFFGTEYQLAGLFTKALPKERFVYLVHRIGMRCMTPTELEHLEKLSS
ncbi:integrase, catalytic region, zinc finger, CCHC-type containing protein [Tanacetum coccineum]